MADDTVKQRKKITGNDLKEMLPFFQQPSVDYDEVKAFVDREFYDDAVIYSISLHSIDALRAIDEGRTPVVTCQLLIAKGVLNFIINIGRIKSARMFLAACLERWKVEKFLEMETVLRLSDQSIDKLDFLDLTWMDYQVHDRKAKTTVILFTGIGNRFGVPINAFMLWLGKHQVNAIYLRDYPKQLYLGGVANIGNMEETIARLKEDLAHLGTERLVCIGNSGGVYGALVYGQRLGADEVLCFAGPTSLDVGNQVAAERPVYESIGKLVAEGILTEPDLRAEYSASKIPVRLFFGEECQFDAVQAKTFDGIPTVRIEPVANWNSHFVIGELARLGKLDSILDEAVTGVSAPGS